MNVHFVMPEDSEDFYDAGVLGVFGHDDGGGGAGASEGLKLPMMTYGAKKGKRKKEIERERKEGREKTRRIEQLKTNKAERPKEMETNENENALRRRHTHAYKPYTKKREVRGDESKPQAGKNLAGRNAE